MEQKPIQQQKQILTQSMRQSLQILQMSTPELLQHVQAAALENPLIELEALPQEDAFSQQVRLHKQEWLERVDEANSYRHQACTGDERAQMLLYDKNQGQTLADVLLLQLPGFKLEAGLEPLVRVLIHCLDKNGYLPDPVMRAPILQSIPPAKLELGVSVLHKMDPPGVGARNLRECLLIQARRAGSDPLLITIISDHLDALAKNRPADLAARLGVPVDELKAARAKLTALNPKPGNGYASHEKIPYVRPDISIVCIDDELEAIYHDHPFALLRISSLYSELTKEERMDPYVRECLKNAKLLLSCVDQRKKTILDCARVILRRQQLFFQAGPGNLAPMTLQDIAEDLSLHPSTISRAVSEKYLQCQWGIYALSTFFSRGLGKEDTDFSQDMIRARMRQLIREEPPQSPFSDQKIADLLGQQGIPISRRTVAKYRDLEGISPASMRKTI